MIKAPGIMVNGISISVDQINEEVQYHPSSSLLDAKYQAMRALVIRELLLQEAVRQGFGSPEDALFNAEEMIDELLEKEISVPEAEEDNCRHYYESNLNRFYTAPLFEVSHIFFPVGPGDKEEREKVSKQAKKILRRIQDDKNLFEKLARECSACSSAKEGGRLGQITKGQTLPAFEAALHKMQAGDLSLEPVESEVGFHIIKVHEREDGKLLPFESVQQWIADYMEQQSWQRAVRQYIQILAGNAEISGFQLESTDTPLVQ